MSNSISSAWNPTVYGQRFVEERSRPGVELIQRAKYAASLSKAANPSFDVKVAYDLGCGNGRLLPNLVDAFPSIIKLIGLDHSDEMLADAAAYVKKSTDQSKDLSVNMINADLNHWIAEPKADLLFSNACIQYLPNHMDLLKKLMDNLNIGGVLAIQLPHVLLSPSRIKVYDVLDTMLKSGDIDASVIENVHKTASTVDPAGLIGYHQCLSPLSSHVDVWETIYYHNVSCPVIKGQPCHPVAHFLQGSSIGQISATLPESKRALFMERYVKEMHDVYPVRLEQLADGGSVMHCVFPFSRWFMVAVKKETSENIDYC